MRNWLKRLSAAKQAFSSHMAHRSSNRGSRNRTIRVEPLEERALLAVLAVDSLDDGPVNWSDGDTTLRDAIALAASSSYPDADEIVFDGSLGLDATPGTITLTDGELLIESELTVTGPGAEKLTIDAAGTSRVFHVDVNAIDPINVGLSNMTITGGSTTGDGGGIFNRETLTASGLTIVGNSAGSGGGLRSYGQLTVTDCTIEGNSANYGGGLEITGPATVTETIVRDNTAANFGGGIQNSGTQTLISDSTITGNSATDGGGLFNNSTIALVSCTVTGNEASNDGGGVANSYGGDVVIANSALSGNTAVDQGGGIYKYSGDADIVNTTIAGNEAADGGGIYLYQWLGSVDVVNSIVALNTATSNPQISGSPAESYNNVIDVDPDFLSDPSDGGDGWGDDPATPGVDESANDDYGQLQLLTGSAAIDTASNLYLDESDSDGTGPDLEFDLNNSGTIGDYTLTTDRDGAARIAAGIVDAGAYEFSLVPDPLPINLVSTASPYSGGNGPSVDPSISSDGRYVAFSSDASDLVASDNNGASDIFVKDMSDGSITRVSTDGSGAEGNGAATQPSISADGRYVAFRSYATNLVSGDTNSMSDVFVKDLSDGSITRVSTDASGAEGNNYSYEPSISADGRYVAFRSFASNLVSGDGNGTSDIFVKDLADGSITRVSTDASGTEANAASGHPSISADGSYVAFWSDASNLVFGDTNSLPDVFVKDLTSGSVTRVSTDAIAGEADGGSVAASISADGRYVAFHSFATNLVPGDTNGSEDVFLKELSDGSITRVSTDAANLEGNGGSSQPSISADGRYVAFWSYASNLVPGDGNSVSDVFVKDLTDGAITRMSTDPDGVEGNGASAGTSMSANGQYVAFYSDASNLHPDDSTTTTDVFRAVLADEKPPTVTSITPSIDSGTLPAGTTTLDIEFSEPVVGGDAASNFELRSLGPDGLLGTADDDLVAMTAGYSDSVTTLSFAALPESVYRLTVYDTITDAVGNALDGDGDSVAGADWSRDFVVTDTPTYELVSPNGFVFDPLIGGWGAGQFVEGSGGAFDGLGRLEMDGIAYAPLFSLDPTAEVHEVSATVTDMTPVPNTATVVPGLSTNITLEEPSVVRLSAAINVANFIGDGYNLEVGFRVDGSYAPYTHSLTSAGVGQVSGGSVTLEDYMTLPAGVHTIEVLARNPWDGTAYRYRSTFDHPDVVPAGNYLRVIVSENVSVYEVDATVTDMTPVPNTATVVPGLSTNITLEEPNVVRLSAAINVANFIGDGYNLEVGFRVDGSYAPYTHSLTSAGVGQVSGGSVTLEDYMTLPAGVHTIEVLARNPWDGTAYRYRSTFDHPDVVPAGNYLRVIVSENVSVYEVDATVTDMTPVPNTATVVPGLSTNITLEEPNVVRLSAAINVANFIGDGYNLEVGFRVDGSYAPYTHSLTSAGVGQVSGGSVTLEDYMTLPAGVHTIEVLARNPWDGTAYRYRSTFDHPDVVPADNYLRLAAFPYLTEALDDESRTLIMESQAISDLLIHREITVPNTGSEDFARTIDVFENPTGADITTTVRIVGNLGSDAATTVWGTSSCDTTLETTDQWIGTDDADGTGTPAIVHYIHGPLGLQPTSVNVIGDNIEWTYDLTVPAGETVRLAHYTILADSRADAQAAAEALVTTAGFGGEAAAFLTQDELASLANFQDEVAPTIVGTSPTFAATGTLPAGTTTLDIEFSEPVVGGDVASNFELRSLGPDGLLGTADDDVVSLAVSYSERIATLSFTGLTENVYRLIVRSTITDTVGNALDGDEDGVAGGESSSDFLVNASGVPYRWQVFDTAAIGWAMEDDASMFGDISPSQWAEGNVTAAQMATDLNTLSTLFTNRGYAGTNAMIWSELSDYYLSDYSGNVAAALFRIKNSTDSAITWNPSLCFSTGGDGDERASIAVNGSLVWAGSGTGASRATLVVSVPPDQTSTMIVTSTRAQWTSWYGKWCTTQLGFGNNSLDLPEGLEFVDDLPAATPYRWQVFDTAGIGWAMEDDASMFGGVSPSQWAEGNVTAAQMSTDLNTLSTLFTNKSYAGANAMIWSELSDYYPSDDSGNVVAALFRIENSTDNAITWNPSFYFSTGGDGDEVASIAVNGSLVWAGSGSDVGHTTQPITLPANHTSTMIVTSTRAKWTSWYGEWYATQLGFDNNSLDLPEGLQFVDDLPSSTVYRWQVFDTAGIGWTMSNDASLFGGVNPSQWAEGDATAAQMSTDLNRLSTLFTNKGYAGTNAMIFSDLSDYYSSDYSGKMVAALFRIENSTSNAITWNPSFYFATGGDGGERASIAVNGSLVWAGPGKDVGHTTQSIVLPSNQTSTVIVTSTRAKWTSWNGEWYATQLGFDDNSLDLPEGLRFVDDLPGGIPSISLISATGSDFDIDTRGHGAGQLLPGDNNTSNGLSRLQVAGNGYTTPEDASVADTGHTVVTPQTELANLLVHREITVPDTGSEDFARTIDVFENPTGADITTTVRIVGNLGSDKATTVWGTSSGDTTVETTDQWIGTDDADGTGTPAIVHYIHGPRGLQPTSVNVIGDNIEWTYDLTVPAGESVRLAHYTILADSRADAQAAEALVTTAGFGGEAAAFLTQDELDSLANFEFNQAPTVALQNVVMSLPENTDTSDRTKVADITITDDDLGANDLSLSGTDAALFEIDGLELFIQAGVTLDFETNPILDVTVEVDDTAVGTSPDDSASMSIAITDVNESRYADILGRASSSGDWFVAKSDGTSFANEHWGKWSTAVSWSNVFVGDFTGDGKDDVVGRADSTGDWFVAKATDSGFVTEHWGKWTTAVTWDNIMVGDFNGDGKDDLVGRAASSGDWFVGRSTGTGFAMEHWGKWTTAVNWNHIQVGDFNGDGYDDLVGRAPSSGDWFVAKSSSTNFATEHWGKWTTAVTWSSVLVGDFNGDGKDDVVGRADSSGDWFTSRSTGSSFAFEHWGKWTTAVNWDNIMVGDFNGDGYDDLIGRAPSSGDWFVARSSSTSFAMEHWGKWTTAVNWSPILTGDFTGDGKDDLAARADSSGDWFVSRSTGTSLVFEHWGRWTTSVPWVDIQVGDFDGAGGSSSGSVAGPVHAAAALDQFWSDFGDDDEEEEPLVVDAVDLWLMER